MGWTGRIWKAMLAAAPLRLWALFAAGPALTAGTAALVMIVWRGGWPESLRGKQLDFLGWAMLGCLALVAVIVVTLAAVKVKGTVLGTTLEIDGDDSAAPTTTTVTVEQKPAS
jgi:hypothetical protein